MNCHDINYRELQICPGCGMDITGVQHACPGKQFANYVNYQQYPMSSGILDRIAFQSPNHQQLSCAPQQ